MIAKWHRPRMGLWFIGIRRERQRVHGTRRLYWTAVAFGLGWWEWRVEWTR